MLFRSPTESIADKIPALLLYLDQLLLHVSRGVRWDSDHVVTFTDELQAITQEIVRNGYLGRVHIGLDYFDASINRIAAYVIGTRCMIKALLIAMLEPIKLMRKVELDGDYTSRLAIQEELLGNHVENFPVLRKRNLTCRFHHAPDIFTADRAGP